LSHRPATPMGHSLGLGPQGRVDYGFDLFSSKYWFATPTRSDLPQTPQALRSKALAPQGDGVAIDGESGSDAQVGSALRGRQHDPATQCYLLGSSVRSEPLLKLFTLVRGQSQSSTCTAHNRTIADTEVIV
ncbi:MAG TPA: hypothetical protein VGH29_18310, partial [Candidatus Binataceae bacterium]